MRQAAALLLAAIAAVLLTGGPARAASPSPSTAPASPVVGLVLEIRADQYPAVEGFTLQTQDGANLEFALGDLDDTSFPGYHLFEHQPVGEAVRVGFTVARDGMLVANHLGETAVAWLDRSLPADASPGTIVQLGAMVYPFSPLRPNVFFRFTPVTAGGSPSEVAGTPDGESHYSGALEVPAGGIGELEIGYVLRFCAECERTDALLDIGGVGPPPYAPLDLLASVSILPPAESVIAGQPFDLELEMDPAREWEPGTFPYPEALTVQDFGPEAAAPVAFEAPAVDRESGVYRATVTLSEAGRHTIRVTPVGPDAFDLASETILAAPAPEPVERPPALGVDPLILAVVVLGVVVVGGLGLFALRQAG